MVRFTALCLILFSSVVESAYLLSQVCKSDAAWKKCTPLEQKIIKDTLEKCRKQVLEDARISTGGTRRLGQQEQRQLKVDCPEPLSCDNHDSNTMCFEEHSHLGCDSHFGGMEMSGKEQNLANQLSKCTLDAIPHVQSLMLHDSPCYHAAATILGGCEQIAYVFL